MTEARESSEPRPVEPPGDEDPELDAAAIASLVAAGDTGDDEPKPAGSTPEGEDSELDAAAIAALLKGGDPGDNEPRPAEPEPGGEDPELDAAAIAARLKGGDPGDDEPEPAGPPPEDEDSELDAAAIAALLKGGDPGDDKPEPAGPPPEDEDSELDAAAIAALLKGGDPGHNEPGAVAPAAEPTPVARPPQPTPVARAPEPTPVARAAEPAEPAVELIDIQLTLVTESEEVPPAETAPAAHAHEPVPEVVAPEPPRGPSWLGRAVRRLRERWAEEPTRAAHLAARLREGAARARCALARSAKEEAPAPDAAHAAEPAPVEEPAREPKAPAEESEAQPRVARLVLVSLCVNAAAMAALLTVLFLRPHDSGHARADGRSRDHAAAHAPARSRRGALPGPTLKLGDFFILLPDDAEGPEGGRGRYARISFELELPDERAKQAASSRLPLLRDAALIYLSDRTAEELRGCEALGHVKAVLARRFSEAAPSVPVRAVYLSDLVVQ